MKVKKPFPIPEDPPAVPMQLMDKTQEAMRGGLTEVDVMLEKGGGWMVVNGVEIEDADTPSAVAPMLKMCADYDAETKGKSARYRVQMWMAPGKQRGGVRKYCNFFVEIGGDEAASGGIRVSTEWKEVYSVQSEIIGTLKDAYLDLVTANNARAKEDGVLIKEHNNTLRVMASSYREGVQYKSDAITSVMRAKAEAERERARADAALSGNDDDDEFWKQMKPMFAAAMVQVMDKVGLGDMRALPPAKADKQSGKQTARQSAKEANKQPKHEKVEINAEPVEPKEPPHKPLHILGKGLLDGLGATVLLELMRILSSEQNEALLRISKATDEQTSAAAILELSQSLAKQPGLLLQMQQLMGAGRAKAFLQLAALAKDVTTQG